ncbi:MAG: tyrosine transporter [Parachlamydiaceae bacterium]|nr:tyrosine transporter [Parachlamydiaceae bacterium]
MSHKNRILGGILLVAGTTIGAGMLALPVSTGRAGFIPSILLFIACWLYMTFTAFLMLEVTLWMGEGANLVSMAKRTLGKTGELISWGTYLFLLYALTTAYVAGSGTLTANVIQTLTGFEIPHGLGSLPLILLFGFFVYKGTEYVDHVNRFLMLGLVTVYVVIVILLTPAVDPSKVQYSNSIQLWTAVSLVITSFGFHIIIPSLSTYLKHNVSALKITLLVGSVIPLIVYIIWEFLILGIVPVSGPLGLAQGYEEGIDGTLLLSRVIDRPIVIFLSQIFSFCAIVTSFLGVSLSLSDFLADGLRIQKTRIGKLGLYILTFIPPLVFTLIDPRAFFSALEYAGAFGVITLLGLLPALMVWRGRYYQGLSSTFQVPGGKIALVGVIAISLVVISLEIAHKILNT